MTAAVCPAPPLRKRAATTGRALRAARSVCENRGTRLTPIRRAVLEILLQARKPLGAYALMSRLGAVLGRRLKPPTVYRALQFLLAQGLASRIESQSAYTACRHPGHHAAAFFLCERCDCAIEVDNPALDSLLDEDAGRLGFAIAHRVVELQGTCARCRDDGVALRP